jgi:hypothetical protein
MIKFLAYSVLAAIIGIFISTHALTITKHIVMAWVWLYSAIAPKEDRDGRREEARSHIYELINTHQKAGYAPKEIAVRVLECGVIGMVDDIAWCIPFIPERLADFADRVRGWSDTLRHYRIPNIMIAGVATLVLMNYAYFSSQSNLTAHTWLLMNGIAIAVTVLIWKREHPLVRRIFNIWMGLGIAAGIAIMVWLTINYHLYQTMTFKVFILAMVAASPAVIVFDKSWRKRLFRDKWWPIIIWWATIVAGACVGSLLIAHDVKLLLGIWGAMVLLVAGLLIVVGATTFGAYILCWLGIRGSAGALQLLASGIRRLR